MEALRALPVDESLALLVGLGVPEADARAMWEAGDATMDGCILDVYRSAVPNAAHDWGSAVGPTQAPRLVLVATADAFGNEALSADMAARLGARTERLDGLGHWWALQDPAGAAAVLTKFWASL